MIRSRRISQAVDEQIKKVDEIKKEEPVKAPKKSTKKKKGE